MTNQQPALGMIELTSVSRGIKTVDALVKKACVTLLLTNPISSGKYMIMFAGGVAEVDEALKAGVQLGSDLVVNHIFIPNLHHDVLPAFNGAVNIAQFDALGIIETSSVASCIMAADKAAKTTPAHLVEIHLGNRLGGKGYFILSGELADIEASVESAETYAKDQNFLVNAEVIPAPHDAVFRKSIYWDGE